MVIAKMLAADLDQRYQEMDSVRNDLQFVADRLKIDLSWHRIRSYVGRLMGILGRAPDRATLSNLKVASEYSPAAASLGTEATTSASPSTAAVAEALDLRVGGGGPVTQAVKKDLLDAPPPVPEPPTEEELLIGDAPALGGAIGGAEEEDTDETVAIPGVQAPAQELLAPAAAPLSVGSGLDEPTAVATSDSWAVGGQADPLAEEDTDRGEDGEHPSSWEVADEEETRVYGGQSARETGVLGAGSQQKTPPPAQRVSTDSTSQLGPSTDGDETAVGPPSLPDSGGSEQPSGSMWVFSEGSSLGLDPQPVVAEAAAPPRRRRRRRKKKSTVRILVAMFVGALGAALVILLLVMKKLNVPPFDTPAAVSGEVEPDSDIAPVSD
jgi:hypothetical protein